MSGEQANTQVLRVDGREIVVTSADKVLWPQDGLTKADLLDYYQAVAPVMLPYLRDHPVTLRVFPGGIDRPGHYRRDLPKDAPDWLPSATYRPASREGELHAPLIQDAAALLWYAERGALEFHMWLATADRQEQPDWAVFDLDPGDAVDFPAVLEAALLVRDALAAQGIDGYPKTSGGGACTSSSRLSPSTTSRRCATGCGASPPSWPRRTRIRSPLPPAEPTRGSV